jgi:alkylated DNA nucleotide flippase Atl1
MAATRPYDIAELRTLLQSEDGGEILELLMEDSTPSWWRQLRKEIALCKARAHQERARQEVMRLDQEPLEIRSRRQVKRFSDADRRLHADLAEKETAVGLLRQDADRSVDRAMAQAKAPLQIKGARR